MKTPLRCNLSYLSLTTWYVHPPLVALNLGRDFLYLILAGHNHRPLFLVGASHEAPAYRFTETLNLREIGGGLIHKFFPMSALHM